MYAGVNSSGSVANNVAVPDDDNSSDIPEWKKLLIMKKRAGSCINVDEHSRRNPDMLSDNIVNTQNGDNSTYDNFPSSNKFCRSTNVVEQDYQEISPLKTVTIGHINVELRSVKSSVETPVSTDSGKLDRTSNLDFNVAESEDDDCEDLQYGPGIVDRLRVKFLNMGAKKQRKPVRRFSSLESLPCCNAKPFKINSRNIRQNGFKVGSGNCYGSGNVKKAQSMETLIYSTPEQQIFTASRRPNARYVGVKSRILAKNITPIMYTDEIDEPTEKSPSPVSSPRKTGRRWDYNRSVSAPCINEDELPKPDTVKHVKKIFETPIVTNCGSEKPSIGVRLRRVPGTTTSVNNIRKRTTVSENVLPVVKKLDAKRSVKESIELSLHIQPKEEEEELLSPARDAEKSDDNKVDKRNYSPVLDDSLSDNRPRNPPLTLEDNGLPSSNDHNVIHFSLKTDNIEESENSGSSKELPLKVTLEQLPLECYKHSVVLSQGTQVAQSTGAELLKDEVETLPHPLPGVNSPDEGMVIASDSPSHPKKEASWLKAPPVTTSIVFDFRGKDVKPNISLSPTPFGCRPARVSQKKRSGSPPRSGVNESKIYEVDDDQTAGDEEDWDEMDIGADLPAISGIVFTGENVKVGRGAILETRNKKLTIQFDDRATSTFEYPSENGSPSPVDENERTTDSSFNSLIALGSSANSRLSNYTPQAVSSNTDFEFGISQPNHRSNYFLMDKNEKTDDVPTLDAIIPAKPEDAGGWSSTNSTDILF